MSGLKLSEFQRLDINYHYYYGSLYSLMERAGASVASTVKAKYGTGNTILVVCGHGNKAGDGLVAARILSEGNDVTVIPLRGKDSIRAHEARTALEKYKGKFADPNDLEREIERAEIIIDAMLGTGISGEPRPPYDTAIEKINASGANKVSIDVPSGFLSSLAIKPNVTVTFHDVKEGMTPENSGEIEIADVGIPHSLYGVSGPGDYIYYPEPKSNSHKGMNGVLGIIGGWTYHGSAAIAAMGALSIGTDLVDVIVPPDKVSIIASYSPEIIVRSFGESILLDSAENINRLIKRYSAMLIGPGLGNDRQIKRLFTKIVQNVRVPCIIDADGIRMLAGEIPLFSGRKFIFTPHEGEFRTLTGMGASERNAVAFAKKSGSIVVLKGREDIITDGHDVFKTSGGNARLTMGGTGDLLAGIIGGLISRGMPAVEASRLATFVEKKTAEELFKEKGYWYSVSDMINKLPFVMKEIKEFTGR